MNNIFYALIISLSVFAQSAFAHSRDVYGTDNLWIKVTNDRLGENVKFEVCELEQPESCRTLGPREFYSKKKLIETAKRLRDEAIPGSNAQSLGIGLLTAVTTGVVCVAIIGTGPIGVAIAIYSATMAGGSAIGIKGNIDMRSADQHQLGVSNVLFRNLMEPSKKTELNMNITNYADLLEELLNESEK